MPRPVFAAAALAVGLLLVPAAARAAEPTGTWLTQNGDARVRIAPCGKNICGTIVWLKEPIDPQTGRPHLDDKNPDPSRRTRKIIGLRIFAMAPNGEGGWSGPIYNSDDGRTYAGKVLVRGPAQIEVAGCAGALCGSETWSRVGR
jgi:uncharacterized protein (DUF2147 family)